MATIEEVNWNDQDDQSSNKAGGEDEENADHTDEFLNDNQLDPEYDKKIGDDIAFDESADEDKDFEAHLAPQSVDPGPNPNETPETEKSKQEGSGYSPKREYNEPQEGNNASYSERTDVTPPNHKEFPTRDPGKADFESRDHGRTTGRMVGHEPGTEGI